MKDLAAEGRGLGADSEQSSRQLQAQMRSTVDRIDSSLGYVKGNVWVVSYRANAIKRDATPEELRRIADAIVERQSS